MQNLAPKQRAVLILREVLGFSANEVSESLETSVASVNSALQRARATVDERLPERSQQETLRTLGDDRVREVVENYMDAMERCDVDPVLAMLTEDATWSMPPMSTWWSGHADLGAWLRAGPFQASGSGRIAPRTPTASRRSLHTPGMKSAAHFCHLRSTF